VMRLFTECQNSDAVTSMSHILDLSLRNVVDITLVIRLHA
jgi:hypothetical protein